MLSNERKETVYRFDVDLPKWMYDWYVEHGRTLIQNDRAALFNYGVKEALKSGLLKPEGKHEKSTR